MIQKNANLRRRRHSPHRLFPGDVIWIPAASVASPIAEQQQESSNTGKEHSFETTETTETTSTAANADDISDQVIGSHALALDTAERGKVIAQQLVAKPPSPSIDTIAQPKAPSKNDSFYNLPILKVLGAAYAYADMNPAMKEVKVVEDLLRR